MDVDDDARMIGRRLRRIRQARRKSLRVVAGLAGISASQLSRIETGQRALDSFAQAVALADVLQVAPSELVRLPVPAPANGHTDSAIEAVRRALEAVEQELPGGLVLTVDVLRDRVDQIYQMRRRCQFAQVAAALPALIRDLHTSLTAGRDLATLLPLTAIAHVRLTYMWLRDAGAPADLLRQAAGLARKVACEHGEVTTCAVATFGTVYALINSGMFDLARIKLDLLPLPAVTPETAGLVGELLLARALVAALERRLDDVAAPVDAATELAERFGEPVSTYDQFGCAFGPTDVGLYRMDLALEAGEPDRLLSIARGVHPQQHPWATRQAAYWVWCGQALARVRGRRDDAVMAFRRAELISPHHVHRNPMVREVIGELLARVRDDAPGRELRRLAYRAGLSI